MKIVVFVTLLCLYDCKEQSKPRSVNLALETVLEFDNYENSADLQIIDKVKSFLDRVKFFIGKNKTARRSFDNKNLIFTDFVKNAMVVLSQYDDNDLADILRVANDEIGKYHYRDCKFYELIENYNIRRFMTDQFEIIKNTPAKKIRSAMNKVLNTIEQESFDQKQKKLVDYVNSLYQESGSKVRKFLENLALYKVKSKRSNMELVKIVRDGLRSVFFDHYSGLDFKTRRELKMKLETFWKDLSHPEAVVHQVWKFKPFNKIKKDKVDDKRVEDISSESLDIEATSKRNAVPMRNKVRYFKPSDKNKEKLDSITLKKNKQERIVRMKQSSEQESEMAIEIERDTKTDVRLSLGREIGKNKGKTINKIKKKEVQDSDMTIDVEGGKDIEIKKPRPSKREKLTFITLYPEAITFMENRKVTRTTKKSSRFQTLWNEPIIHKSRSRKRQEMKKKMAQHQKETKKEDDNSSEMNKIMEEQEQMKEPVAKKNAMKEKTKKDRIKKKKHGAKQFSVKDDMKKVVAKKDNMKNSDESDEENKVTVKKPGGKKNIARNNVMSAGEGSHMKKMMAEHEELEKEVEKAEKGDVKEDEKEDIKEHIKDDVKEEIEESTKEDTKEENVVLEHEAEIAVEREKFTALERERDMKTTAKMMLRNKDVLKRASKLGKQEKVKKFRSRKPVSDEDELVSQGRDRQWRHRKSRKFFKVNPQDSTEGLPIDTRDLASKSFRKHNFNDTLTTKANIHYPGATKDVIKRINDLEMELKSVKAQMVDKPDYIEIPTYDKLDFWQGTTKDVTARNATRTTAKSARPTTTFKTTTTVKTTTRTTTNKPTKTTSKPTTIIIVEATTESLNSTYLPVFRSMNISDESHIDNKFKEKDEKKTPENQIEEVTKNYTGVIHMLDVNNDVYNNSANIDDLNDIATGLDAIDDNNLNITAHIDDLEKYLNSTKDDPNDKEHIVRKKMYEELKGILDEGSEDQVNGTAKVLSDKDIGKNELKSADPLAFMDDTEPILK